MKKLVLLLFLITVLLPLSVFADNIRGEVVRHVIISDSTATNENSFSMGIEDVFAVSIDGSSSFITGFEIEIRVPSLLRNYSSSFALNIYKQITPAITSGMGTYYGKKYHSLFLPEATRFYIRVPYLKELPGETAPYTTVISEPSTNDDSPFMITILPMMKGFPSSLYSSNFEIRINPIIKDSGFLNLSIVVPEDLDSEELSINLDGKAFDEKITGIRLTSGPHNIIAEIPGGRSVNRNFTIRRGESTDIKMEIEKLESFANFEVPDDTVIFLDGEKLDLSPEKLISIAPGEHTVLFKIADYKISKKFTVTPGKDCKISLFLDIFIEEN